MVDSLWYVVATDSIGPFKQDRITKARYITVFIDAFSRYVELCPVISVDSKTTADAFLNCVFLRHGTPKEVLSDNGSQFANDTIMSY
jgi:transposase InsO family protein